MISRNIKFKEEVYPLQELNKIPNKVKQPNNHLTGIFDFFIVFVPMINNLVSPSNQISKGEINKNTAINGGLDINTNQNHGDKGDTFQTDVSMEISEKLNSLAGGLCRQSTVDTVLEERITMNPTSSSQLIENTTTLTNLGN